ncbi:peptidylprolyl isomerase [Acidisphaera sp. L21]|uniref:peptidylprolyl isomerase n=1 Tax=Acidisphaera sp. L21 TaxID=1641851 RepID=UPI00131E7ED5|nr:peptidylprolyl isomerase [Acidisphaera sp. L21]
MPEASRCPEVYIVSVTTTKGRFLIEAHRNWSAHGAQRLYNLANEGYYNDSRFFRVVTGKWAQFGIAGDPATAQLWRDNTIPDDKLIRPNHRGFVAFSNTGPATRSTQIYINLGDNSSQNDGEPAFAPFGQIVSGMDVVDSLYAGYGEASGSGMRAGRQDPLFAGGNSYLDTHYPKLDKLLTLQIEVASVNFE